MSVDYVRVYQDPTKINIGCDPEEMPTASYIARYPDAYHNPNIVSHGTSRCVWKASLIALHADDLGSINEQRSQTQEQFDRHVLSSGQL